MKEDAHRRARSLMDALLIEEKVSAEERRWLEQHLAACESCAERAAASERAVRAVRSFRVEVNSALVRSTQMKVRLRAREMEAHRRELRPVWLSCVFALLLTAAGTPFVWQGLEWFSSQVGTPGWVVKIGFLWLWFIPSVLAALAMGYGLVGEHLTEKSETGWSPESFNGSEIPL